MSNYRKVIEFKTVADFREYLAQENFAIPLVDVVPSDGSAALAQPIQAFGQRIGNRWAILPMEGWDCLPDGSPSEYTRRRWLHFASSGAKLIYGTEAAAVMTSGRSNPRQLMAVPDTTKAMQKLCREMRQLHRDKFGCDEDLCIGLQLTHSGRFSHPHDDAKREAVTAYAHPLLDKKFANTAANVLSDDQVGEIIEHFITAAKVAQEAGFNFIDFKHAHGYLGHEFLTAHERPGRYGGSWENRTRFFREVAAGIKKACPDLKLSARLSIFDLIPFYKGEDGVGQPMDWQGPYPYAFGSDSSGLAMDPDLQETTAFVQLMQKYGIDLICGTIGSPYYNVHAQRPAYYPVSDGYAMPEHPLYNVARHLAAVKRLREKCPGLLVVGAGYTCLQEYLPHAAEAALANDWTDFVGIGRMVLSYPEICADVLAGKSLDRQRICRTFGDCTSAPRNGMISGCFPLDDFYKRLPEAERLKQCKRAAQDKQSRSN